MRRHGWGGDLPSSDEEAVRRIIAATRRCIDRHGAETTVSEVARELGVTRPTVYRYFRTTRDLLTATAIDASAEFLVRVRDHVAAEARSAADVVVETIAFVAEAVRQDPYVGLLLHPERSSGPEMGFSSQNTVLMARALLEDLPVDWAVLGYDGADLDDLVRMMLRTTMSFVVDPGDPPMSGTEIRAYLRRWIVPALVDPATEARIAEPRRSGRRRTTSSERPSETSR
jgi:AcrR family transcriptional regulator